MKYLVKLQGSPLRPVETLVDGYLAIRDEFKKRWPRAFYGPSEAAAHGLTLEGVPELTPHEAAEMRRAHHEKPTGTLADALRKGRS